MDIAARLREHLSQMQGFISVERFASLTGEGKLCSLSFWEDEAAVTRWREFELHAVAQQEGIEELFENYRIRVGNIIRDNSMKGEN